MGHVARAIRCVLDAPNTCIGMKHYKNGYRKRIEMPYDLICLVKYLKIPNSDLYYYW